MTLPYLSYSGRKTYLSCPLAYKLGYIDHIPGKTDRKSTVFGAAIGKVFEWFYEKRVWAEPNVKDVLIGMIDDAMRYSCRKAELDLQLDSDFIKTTRDSLDSYVLAGIETIRQHKLLSPDSRAEVKLDIDYTNPKTLQMVRIGGRADFIHRFEESVWILDGKASAHRDKYVDPEQLVWYAVQFYLKYHILPDRLGFVFWRFPTDPIQWVACDADALRRNLNNTFEVMNKIQKAAFDPYASDYCYFCGYNGNCNEGIRYMAAKRIMKGGRIESSIFDLESA